MSELTAEGGPPPLEENYFLKFYKNVKDNKLEKKVIPIRGDSAYTLQIHDDNSIDIAFVDGDNSYEGCKKDLNILKTKIKKDGVIVCHDFNNNDIKRAIFEFIEENNIPYGNNPHGSLMYEIKIPFLLTS